MSTWNYRLVNVTDDSGDHEVGLYEVYYDDAGHPISRTLDPAEFVGENADEIRKALKRAIKATGQAVLRDSEIGSRTTGE